MLPDRPLASLPAVLEPVQGSSMTPTFRSIAPLVTGPFAQTWSDDRAHAFFSRAA
ncbi:hypothetical protein [Streptomyces sp. MUSC 14]|uniref:hypothetical protein n=1 Tax=Streptomyces sp. MUSC 14 TaxID=1354889 RepID=UPI0015A6BB4D|nr:hypothetical protein [Streptomyces sp. MUSC 14]